MVFQVGKVLDTSLRTVYGYYFNKWGLSCGHERPLVCLLNSLPIEYHTEVGTVEGTGRFLVSMSRRQHCNRIDTSHSFQEHLAPKFVVTQGLDHHKVLGPKLNRYNDEGRRSCATVDGSGCMGRIQEVGNCNATRTLYKS